MSSIGVKLLLLGYPRTGTTTLENTLIDIGYINKNYHGWTFYQNRERDILFWETLKKFKLNKQENKIDFDQLLLKYNYESISDDHAVLYWKYLIKQYCLNNNTKIILTMRDSLNWYESHYNGFWILSLDLLRWIEIFISLIPIKFCKILTRYQNIKNYHTKNMLGNNVWSGYKNKSNQKYAIKKYQNYYTNVIKFCKKNNLIKQNKLFILNWDNTKDINDKNKLYLDLMKFLEIDMTEEEIDNKLTKNNGKLFPHSNSRNVLQRDILFNIVSIIGRIILYFCVPVLLYYVLNSF